MWRKLNAYITVAEEGGFAKAASKLKLSKATVTRYIQELESEYGVIFFVRTTRHVSLTEQGESFYHFALEMIQLKDEAQSKIDKTADVVQGRIKIGLPTSILYQFAQIIMPRLQRDYPELSVEMIQGNHIHDLLSGHFDVVVHCGLLPNVNFYYEKIAEWQKVLCASPTYLKKFSCPKRLEELREHQCLNHSNKQTFDWRLMVDGVLKAIPVKATIKADSSMILKELAIQGLGIVYLPSFTVSDALADKRLKPILKNNWPEPLPIYALFPRRKGSSKKIGVIIQALRELLDHKAR